jgi:hypothetical protein
MSLSTTHIICVGAVYIDTVWTYVTPQLSLLATQSPSTSK